MGFMTKGLYKLLTGARGALAAALLPLAAAAEPLACDQPAFQFGTVDAATGIVTHAFVLRNPGVQTLILDEVAAPCGCIALKLQTNLLASGESTRLPVTLDLRQRSGAQRLAAHVVYHRQGQEAALILKLSMLGTVTGSHPAPDAAAAPAAPATDRSPETAGGRPVTVELFGAAGCEACATVRRELLPAARELLGGRGIIIERDVYETTNFVVLAAYQERLGVLKAGRHDPVSVVVDGCRYLGGLEEIRRSLPRVLRERLAAADAPPPPEVAAGADTVAARRLAAFSVAGVALAGLLDGLNPCAFATVIFLASLLAIVRVRGAGVLLMGGGFLAGSFATYFLLGLGLFHGLKALAAWHPAAQALDLAMAALLAVLAALSFRDAWRFAHTGRAADVTLRLPDVLRNRVHRLLRSRITPGGLAGGGLAAGVLVTLLESVCTGQVYGPTLMAVARDPALRPHAMRLLAIYNLAFLVPVAVVMIAAWRGTTSLALAGWSRRNAVWGKVLMGAFFLALGVLLLAT
jgi:hypothetical protein